MIHLTPMRGVTPREAWRSFATAIRLGWAIESNWSDPLLFTIYTIAKPVSAALILVVMFNVISGGRNPDFLEYLVVGSALWNIVFGVISGLVLGILEDRERYRMTRYVVLTPASLFPFLLGRGLARVLISFVAVAITLAVGVTFLGVRLEPNLLLLPATLFGLVAVGALGIFIAGWCMQLRQEAWSYPEAIAGALYLLSGAIFPLDLLPAPLQPIAWMIPTTWWLEASRRGLLGEPGLGPLGALPDATVLLVLAVTSVVWAALAVVAFTLFERRARQLGLLDMVTGS